MRVGPPELTPEWYWREEAAAHRRAGLSQAWADKFRAADLFGAILAAAYRGHRPRPVWWAELAVITHRQAALGDLA